MIAQKEIEAVVNAQLEGTDYFLVEVSVSQSNNIVVEIDSFDSVDINFCIDLTRAIEQQFDREVEDYELEVGSAGITAPFKVDKQYEKNLGREVEVLIRGGEKLTGTLLSATADSFILAFERMEKQEGSKRKVKVKHEMEIEKQNIKYIKQLIRFK